MSIKKKRHFSDIAEGFWIAGHEELSTALQLVILEILKEKDEI